VVSVRAVLATAVAAALLLQGVAWAMEPVLCPMTGSVVSGRCDCEHGSTGGAVLPRCCNRVEVRGVPSDRPARIDVAPPPVLAVVAVVATPATEVSPAAEGPSRGPSPPLEILHRALLR